MMDCSAYKELSGLRSEDLSHDERDGLLEHIDSCEICRLEQQDDEELLALVDRMPSLESNITAADVWRMDGLDEEASPAATPFPGDVPPRPRRALGTLILAVAAAATLALVVGPRLMDDPEMPADPAEDSSGTTGQRLKAVEAPADRASLDLQLSLETPGLGGTVAIASSDGAIVGAQEKLLFGIRWSGEGDLSLVEVGPEGRVHVVAGAGEVSWHVDEAGVGRMVDEVGGPLAYRPDGPSGSYTYEALLTSPSDRPLTAAEAQQLLRGEDIPEISLLARDAFTIEWRQDDAHSPLP